MPVIKIPVFLGYRFHEPPIAIAEIDEETDTITIVVKKSEIVEAVADQAHIDQILGISLTFEGRVVKVAPNLKGI